MPDLTEWWRDVGGTERRNLWLLAVPLILGLSVPLLLASPVLSVDYSLYLSEAINIASGKGYTFAWGGEVVYRPPGLPAMMAGTIMVLGHSLESADTMTRVIAVLNSLLVLWLGYRAFGLIAGLVAGALAASSAFINYDATRHFIDGAGSFFLLLSLSAYLEAMASERKAWFAASGVAMGCAFLVKESFTVWAGLPAFVWLLAGKRRTAATTVGTVIYAGGWFAATFWWWVRVYLVSGEVYKASFIPPAAVVVVMAFLVGAVAVGELIRRKRGVSWAAILDAVSSGTAGRLSLSRYYATAGVAFILAWMTFMFVMLNRSTTQGKGNLLISAKDYLHDVAAPAIAPNLEIFYVMVGLVLASWAAAGVVGLIQRRLPATVLFIAAALFLPQYLFVADRTLQARNMIPLLYLGFVLFGGALALALRPPGGTTRTLRIGAATLAIVVIAASVIFVVEEEHTFATRDLPAPEFDWNGDLVRSVADWASDHIEPGTPTMSSWLFYSQIYFESDGKFPIRQIPLVHTRLLPSDEVLLKTVRRGPRFENHLGPELTDRRPWLYLRWNPRGAVYFAVSEQTLVEKIQEHRIRYLFVTGENPASSLSFVDYFLLAPGLSKVYDDIQDQQRRIMVFEIESADVRYQGWPLTVDAPTMFQLISDMRDQGLYRSDAERVRAMAPNCLRVCPPDEPTTELLHEYEQELGETLVRGVCPSAQKLTTPP